MSTPNNIANALIIIGGAWFFTQDHFWLGLALMIIGAASWGYTKYYLPEHSREEQARLELDKSRLEKEKLELEVVALRKKMKL
jgi:hypothetical protein